MSLLGEVRVNEYVVGQWEARRAWEVTMVKDSGPRYRYSCWWRRGGVSRGFHIEHLYNDGAEVLAAKVLAYIAEHYPNPKKAE